jgi:hypothetical protein
MKANGGIMSDLRSSQLLNSWDCLCKGMDWSQGRTETLELETLDCGSCCQPIAFRLTARGAELKRGNPNVLHNGEINKNPATTRSEVVSANSIIRVARTYHLGDVQKAHRSSDAPIRIRTPVGSIHYGIAAIAWISMCTPWCISLTGTIARAGSTETPAKNPP